MPTSLPTNAGNRLKVLVHDGHGIWLANRRLNQGRFQLRPGDGSVALTRGQFAALILGLPGTAGRWRRNPGSVTVHHWGSPR
ncbi:MAG: IS66 family insertion sequence element accessory protein TnpB [Betaproteobacteria bacterium]|nr:IS66 family insertion sequence element accessory protein TnpB [Candidatus Dechloromonas phosphorivorans]